MSSTCLQLPVTTCTRLRRTGRWYLSSDSLISSWAGSSLAFQFRGKCLQLVTGEKSTRKDRFNGGTKTILRTVSSGGSKTTSSQDIEGQQTVLLTDHAVNSGVFEVEITLIDWASVLEVKSILVDAGGEISSNLPDPPPRNVLVIGDSISCGWTDGSQEFPSGCLDAFPFVAKRVLERVWGVSISMDLVAYPGITLCDPTEQDREMGTPRGMVSQFFRSSPWDAEFPHSECLETEPEIIVVALGTNDVICGIPGQRFLDALRQLIDRLGRDGTRHFVFMPPFLDHNDQASYLESFAPRFSSLVLGMCSGILIPGNRFHILSNEDVKLEEDNLLDGLHPNRDGHQKLGQKLAGKLSEILESRVLV